MLVYCVDSDASSIEEGSKALKKAFPGARALAFESAQKAVEAFYAVQSAAANSAKDRPQKNDESWDGPKITVRCFGYFEAYWDGKPLPFLRKQSKELFAFLVDRMCSACASEEIASALWEEKIDLSAAKQRIRNLICDIKKTLAKIGMEGALVRDHRKVALRYDALDCDYYRMLNGDPDYVQNFKGEYMVDYSWAEPTAGLLFFGEGKNSFKNSPKFS